MNKEAKNKIPEFNSIDEERKYWESRGPLAKGNRGLLNVPDAKAQRSSFLSVRFSGQELTRWRNLSAKFGIGPSTLARNLIMAYLQQNENIEKSQSNENRQNMPIEKAFDYLSRNLPSDFSKEMENLFNSAVVGDMSNPEMFILYQNQFREFMRLSIITMAKMFEIMNPNVKIEIPPDILDGTAFRPDDSKKINEQVGTK